MGEFNRDDRITQLVTEYVAKGPGLVFVRTKAHARRLASRLALPVVTSEVNKAERQRIAEGLESGAIQAAVATAAWSTGVNIPALRWVILPERVKAPIAVLQSSGRALRQADGKPCYEIINLVDGSTPAGIRYGQERENVLVNAGFEVSADEMKLNELLARDGGEGGGAGGGDSSNRRSRRSEPAAPVAASASPKRSPWSVAAAVGIVILLLYLLDCWVLSWQQYPTP